MGQHLPLSNGAIAYAPYPNQPLNLGGFGRIETFAIT
jgi:hypothetical protein